MNMTAQQPIGKYLLNKGIISNDQLRIALREQSKNHQPLGRLLVRLGFLSEEDIRDVLSENLGQESIDLSSTLADPAAVRLVSAELARRHLLAPLSVDESRKQLVVAIADPGNIIALDQLRARLGNEYAISTKLANESDILRAIDRFYGFDLSIDGILNEIEPAEAESSRQTIASEDEFGHPVVRLIDALLTDAVQQEASDIHFERESNFLRIRYRIDGVLRQVRSLQKNFWPPMLVRLKVMGGMNIAETRAPQDGRFSLHLSGRQIDFRASAHPATHGENLVLRILDRKKSLVPLEQLGLAEDALTTLKRLAARPEGIILVTGPTGSGKTTTLYSVLSHINTEAVNIMTLEDPVEYDIPLIRQTSVNETAKLGFASGIRSMLRQDPDIILVGEIRDQPTAEMAFHAAMTGHQVYSTLHANSALGAIPRLLDMGIQPHVMAGNIIGITAQRLIRKLCPDCKQAYRPSMEECELLGEIAGENPLLYRAVGCDACQHQGYRGRIAIMELLKMDADLDDLAARRAGMRDLKCAALKKGFRPLALDGLQRVAQGITSLAEAARVVDLTDRTI